MSQQACADATRMPRPSYATFEVGRRKLYAHELRRLAVLLRTSVDELLDMPTAPPSDLAEAVAGLPAQHITTLVEFAAFLRSRSHGRHALDE